MVIEERAKKLFNQLFVRVDSCWDDISDPILQQIIVALQAQDAESRKAQRHACAEAASITVRQTRLVAGEYVSCEVANELAQRTHAACMNAEVKNEASRS
jgi:hypothetical protein